MPVGAGSLKRTAKSVSTAKEDAKEVKPAQQENLEADNAATKTVQDKKAPVKAAEAVKKTASKGAKAAKTALQPKGIIKKDAAKNIAQAAAKRAAKEECVSQITCDLPTYLL